MKYMQWFANFIVEILLLDGKFDGSQKLHLANYTRYTVLCTATVQMIFNAVVHIPPDTWSGMHTSTITRQVVSNVTILDT